MAKTTITIHGINFKVEALPVDAPEGMKNLNGSVEIAAAMLRKEIPINFELGSKIALVCKRFLEGNLEGAEAMNAMELRDLKNEFRVKQLEAQQLHNLIRAHRMIARELARKGVQA